MAGTRRIPQRTCIGCRGVAGKRGLIRVVRTAAGEVVVDPSGKKPGRGAYVHPVAACVEAALSGQRLERALKVSIAPAGRERLRVDLEHAVARADLLARLAGGAAPPGPQG